MRRILLVFISILFAGAVFAQSSKDVIVMPEFPGGREAMQEFLLSEMRYPYEAQMNDEIGEVLIGFSVGIDGTIGGVRVLRSVSESLDKEAVRVVKSMPKWKPGTRNGKAVRAELSIPINFAIVKDILEGDNIDTDEKSLRKMVDLYSPKSGRGLEMWSDQVAVQFYSGNFFDGECCSKYGKPILRRGAIVLEAQRYPNAPNQPTFPSIVLTPEQTYTHFCSYKFYTK